MGVKAILRKTPVKKIYTAAKNCLIDLDSAAIGVCRKMKTHKSDVITVVFMCQYIPAWNKMKPVYEKLKADKRFKVILLCIPSDITEHVLHSKVNDVYQYFVSEHYTDAVDALEKQDGTLRWKSLRQFSPDYVFYGRPYNSYMPAAYTSRSVARYAKVCLIMYSTNITKFALDTTINRNFLAYTYIYFATSQELAEINTSRNKLAHRLGFSHTYDCGLIPMEEILLNKDQPHNSWDWSEKQIRVMWTPRWTTDPAIGGSNFFRYKEVLYDYASHHPEMDFLFRPHPMMWDNFIKTGEITEAERDAYISKCNALGNIRFDSNKEYISTLWSTTVLISDISGIMTEFYATGAPLIFCESDIKMSLFRQVETIMDSCYRVNSEAELIETLDQIGRNEDPMRAKRETVVRSMINPDKLPSTVILEHLLADHKGKKK